MTGLHELLQVACQVMSLNKSHINQWLIAGVSTALHASCTMDSSSVGRSARLAKTSNRSFIEGAKNRTVLPGKRRIKSALNSVKSDSYSMQASGYPASLLMNREKSCNLPDYSDTNQHHSLRNVGNGICQRAPRPHSAGRR